MGVTKERKEQDQDQEEGQDMELYERSGGRKATRIDKLTKKTMRRCGEVCMYEMEKNAWQKKAIYTYQICNIYVNKTLYGQKYWVTDK